MRSLELFCQDLGRALRDVAAPVVEFAGRNQHPRLREDRLIVGIDQPADMVGMHVGEEDRVDGAGVEADGVEVVHQTGTGLAGEGTDAGVDQDPVIAGIQQKGVKGDARRCGPAVFGVQAPGLFFRDRLDQAEAGFHLGIEQGCEDEIADAELVGIGGLELGHKSNRVVSH